MNHAVLSKSQIVVVLARGWGNIVPSLARQGDDICLPLSRSVIAKDNCRIDSLTDCLIDSWGNLAQNINLGIIKYRLRDRHDNRQLCRSQIYIIPCLHRSLLHSGVAIHPVCGRKEVQNADTGLLGCHVWKLARHPHECGLFRCILENGRYNLLTD